MDEGRWKLLLRRLLADVLSIGSAATAGPVVPPALEAEILEGLEWRLRDFLSRHGAHEADERIVERFRREHPELFTGPADTRREAARRRPEGDGGSADRR